MMCPGFDVGALALLCLPKFCQDQNTFSWCPYDETIKLEMEVLERVHIDLWGRAHVHSVGGTYYMMLFTDGCSSYRKDFYLSEKFENATLDAIKQYHVEAEQQTGRRLRRFRFDMGKEFVNKGVQDYCKEHGILIEFTTPYAHSSHGVAECSNHTTIKGTRCSLSDSDLPLSLWADAASTQVYIQNLIPSSRHPGQIPAEC